MVSSRLGSRLNFISDLKEINVPEQLFGTAEFFKIVHMSAAALMRKAILMSNRLINCPNSRHNLRSPIE